MLSLVWQNIQKREQRTPADLNDFRARMVISDMKDMNWNDVSLQERDWSRIGMTWLPNAAMSSPIQ
jgi:hypothetical protein